MSTHFTVAVQNEDGSVRQVYGNSDGHVAHAGRILLQHYSDRAKLNKLIDEGEISVLDKEIGEKHSFKYEDRPADTCTFYRRDGGAFSISANLYESFQVFVQAKKQYSQEYDYVYTLANEWIVTSRHFEGHPNALDDGARALAEAVAELNV